MPKKIQKTLQDYLDKMKKPHSQIQSLSSPKSWVLSSCKHPKTPSFAIYSEGRHNHSQKDDGAATLADVDRFLFENFKSLYLNDDDGTEQNRGKTEQNRGKTEENRAKTEENRAKTEQNRGKQSKNRNTIRVSTESEDDEEEEAPRLASLLFESPRFIDPPRDLCGSTRFFVKPGNSGSLVEDALSLTTTTSDEAGSSSLASITTTTVNDSSSSSNSPHDDPKGSPLPLPDNCVALLTYSRSPCEEFRRSMEEMVEARNRDNNHREVAVVDWDFMEELLFCYLNLNEKKTHKFILSAFVDLAADMRRSSENAAAPAKPRSVRTVRIGVEGRKKANGVMLDFGSS